MSNNNIMKNIFNKYLLLIFLCACMSASFAQNKIMIRGVVTAVEDGFPLPQSNVIIQNKDGRIVAATATDLDGNYSLVSDGKKDNILVVSYAGYNTQKIPLGNKTVINVALQEKVTE